MSVYYSIWHVLLSSRFIIGYSIEREELDIHMYICIYGIHFC